VVRFTTAIVRACSANSTVNREPIAQPITRRSISDSPRTVSGAFPSYRLFTSPYAQFGFKVR
jgi:hypothetical protein